MTRSITLPDGRMLSFAEFGHKDGSPVLFCHGLPGSRLHISEEMSRSANALNARIIVPDRPGYGWSDPKRNSSFMDWTRDVLALLETLEIDNFRVLGYSLGAPYALACAYAMPRILSRVSLVAGLAPNIFDPAVSAMRPPASQVLFTMARDNPAQLNETLKAVAADGTSLFAVFAEGVSAPDKALLAQPHIAAIFLRDCVETLRQGHDAASADLIRVTQPWGFDLAAITVPVHLWHGLEDINTPLAMAHYMAANLPRNKLTLLPGEGHLCLFPHWEEILSS